MTRRLQMTTILLTLLAAMACTAARPQPTEQTPPAHSRAANADPIDTPSTLALPYPAPAVVSAYPGPNYRRPPTPFVPPTPTPDPVPPCDISSPVEVALQEANFASPTFMTEPAERGAIGLGFGIVEWLPDNRRLLVTEGGSSIEIVSTLDVYTGETVQYAVRFRHSGAPIWLEGAQAIVYGDKSDRDWTLNLSYGAERQVLVEDRALHYLVQDPTDAQAALVFDETVRAVMGIDHEGQVSPLATPAPSGEAAGRQRTLADPDLLAWSPDGNWVAQRERASLHLIHVPTQKRCQLDVGEGYYDLNVGYRAGRVYWSPDSRYFAALVTRRGSIAELNLWDMETGELRILSLPVDLEPWPPERVSAPKWLPDSQMILVQVGRRDAETNRTWAEWRLINLQTEQFKRVLPEDTIIPIVGDTAWSPDGSMMAYRCPEQENPVCLVRVVP